MKVIIQYVDSPEGECAVLQVYKNHLEIIKLQEIIEKETYKTIMLPCFLGEERYSISCEHILFIETIQEKSFVHTGSKIYESKKDFMNWKKYFLNNFLAFQNQP